MNDHVKFSLVIAVTIMEDAGDLQSGRTIIIHSTFKTPIAETDQRALRNCSCLQSFLMALIEASTT